MLIREATILDANGIARVHVDVWKTTYEGMVSHEFLSKLSYDKSEDGFSRFIHDSANNNKYIFVAEDVHSDIVGFATCGTARENEDKSIGELYAFYIFKEHQSRGVGKLLFNRIKEKLEELEFRSMLIWVLKSNIKACGFYEAMGGKKLKEQDIVIGGDKLREIAYQWRLS